MYVCMYVYLMITFFLIKHRCMEKLFEMVAKPFAGLLGVISAFGENDYVRKSAEWGAQVCIYVYAYMYMYICICIYTSNPNTFIYIYRYIHINEWIHTHTSK
jgi:hypothetical protein